MLKAHCPFLIALNNSELSMSTIFVLSYRKWVNLKLTSSVYAALTQHLISSIG